MSVDTLSDTAIQAAEEAYDEVIRSEGSRSPYLNTRAFRAAFCAAIRIEAGTGGTVKHGPTRSARAGAEGIAQNTP